MVDRKFWIVDFNRIVRGLFILSATLFASCNSDDRYIESRVHLILHNGVIHTMDANRRIVSAIAIAGNQIVQVGNDEEILSLKTPETQLINLDQHMVLPGFFDSHTHMIFATDYAKACQLQTASSKAEMLSLMEACYRHYQESEGLFWGFGYFPSIVGNDINISKQELDDLFPGVPTAIISIHTDVAFLNSAGLDLMGYGTEEGDLTSTYFNRDEGGDPTGRVDDADTIMSRLPTFEAKDEFSALISEVEKLNAYGITSFFDASFFGSNLLERYRVFRNVDERNMLNARANLSFPAFPEVPYRLQSWVYQLLSYFVSSEHVRAETIKVFADDKPHFMLEPVVKDPTGPTSFPLDSQKKAYGIFSDAGFNIYTHAYGDAAVRATLDSIETLPMARDDHGPRYTITHALHVDTEDLPRFKELNVAANIQPVWAHRHSERNENPRKQEQWLGKERSSRELPIRDLLESGARIAFSSDYPYGRLNPFKAIETGITRKHPDFDADVFNPDQAIDLDTLLAGYTINGAYQFNQEAFLGSLESGKLADLIVLNQNLYEIAVKDISETRVDLTVFDGRIVYQVADEHAFPDE